jgi:hypothetical protein
VREEIDRWVDMQLEHDTNQGIHPCPGCGEPHDVENCQRSREDCPCCQTILMEET